MIKKTEYQSSEDFKGMFSILCSLIYNLFFEIKFHEKG